MDTATGVSLAAGTAIVVTLVLTGPLFAAGTAEDVTLGEGTATVERVTLADSPALTPGRFGTGVAYLRLPPVHVRFSSVSGRSRLVYRVAVPALGFDRVADRALSPDTPGTVRLEMPDRAVPYDALDRPRYRATVVVRVQSFAADRVVSRRNVTVEVRTDGRG